MERAEGGGGGRRGGGGGGAASTPVPSCLSICFSSIPLRPIDHKTEFLGEVYVT